jgi:hypothetical protein
VQAEEMTEHYFAYAEMVDVSEQPEPFDGKLLGAMMCDGELVWHVQSDNPWQSPLALPADSLDLRYFIVMSAIKHWQGELQKLVREKGQEKGSENE